MKSSKCEDFYTKCRVIKKLDLFPEGGYTRNYLEQCKLSQLGGSKLNGHPVIGVEILF